jgi:hypothetical protein
MAPAVVGMVSTVLGMTPADVTFLRTVVLASIVETEWHKYNERNEWRWVRYRNNILLRIQSGRNRPKRTDAANEFGLYIAPAHLRRIEKLTMASLS